MEGLADVSIAGQMINLLGADFGQHAFDGEAVAQIA